MEAKKQIWGVGENMGTEESKKIWEENAPREVTLSESFVDVLLSDPIMMALAALLIMLMLTYAVTKIGIKRD